MIIPVPAACLVLENDSSVTSLFLYKNSLLIYDLHYICKKQLNKSMCFTKQKAC